MLRRSIDATGAGIKTAGRRKGERAAERESGSLPAEYLPNTYRIFSELPTEAVVKSVDNCCCGTPGI
jgi:hypothetical protein